MQSVRFWKVGLMAIIVVFVAYSIFTTVPYSVSRSYDGAIYRGSQMVGKLPVKLDGKVYRGVMRSNEFVGRVEIGGTTYFVHTFRRVRTLGGSRRSYPYVGVVGAVNAQNYTVTIASFMMSGDFNSVVASTNAISQKYGKQAELVVTATSSTSVNAP